MKQVTTAVHDALFHSGDDLEMAELFTLYLASGTVYWTSRDTEPEVEESFSAAETISPAHMGSAYLALLAVFDDDGEIMTEVESDPEVGEYVLDDATGATKGQLTLNASETGTIRYAYRYSAPVVWNGHSYTNVVVGKFRAESSLGMEVASAEIEVAPGTATVGGVAMVKAAINGVFDGVRVTIDRAVFLSGVIQGIVPGIFDGFVETFSATSDSITLKVSSALIKLNVQFPTRMLAPDCPFLLGDTDCGVTLASFTESRTLASGSTASVLKLTAAPTYTAPGGTIEITSGTYDGTLAQIRSVSGTDVTLVRPLAGAPSGGVTINITRGCDRSIGANGCAGFSNTARFGGCIALPAQDGA